MITTGGSTRPVVVAMGKKVLIAQIPELGREKEVVFLAYPRPHTGTLGKFLAATDGSLLEVQKFSPQRGSVPRAYACCNLYVSSWFVNDMVIKGLLHYSTTLSHACFAQMARCILLLALIPCFFYYLFWITREWTSVGLLGAFPPLTRALGSFEGGLHPGSLPSPQPAD